MKKTLSLFFVSVFAFSTIFAKTDYKQEFQKAIDKNDSEKITKLMKKCSETDKTEALLYAVIHENKEIVVFLLDSGVNVNQGNWQYSSPLVASLTKTKNYEISKFLLKKGANINTKINNQNESLLHFAVEKQDSELINWLLENEIDVFSKTNFGETVLDYSVKQNSIEVTEKLLNFNGLEIKVDTVFDVIKNGYSEILKVLFKSNLGESLSKNDSFVISAINENQFEILKVFMENNCNPNAKDENQNSALYISAIEKKNYEISTLLIKFGANISELNEGHSLLYKAKTDKNPNDKIIELLVSEGAKLTSDEENDLKYEKFSPRDINRLKRENIFKYDQKINGKIFWIVGRVAGTRNSFFGDEYIIKLEDAEENPFGDRDSVDVVIPKYINEETLSKLSKLEQGNIVSILVKGRSGTSYVDIVLEN